MQAINVRILPVTNTKPARLKAECYSGSLIQSIHKLEDSFGNEARPTIEDFSLIIANNLIEKLNWELKINGIGHLKNGEYVFTLKRDK